MITDQGFTTIDYKQEFDWIRVFCAKVADDSCGLLFFQHHCTPFNDLFDHTKEANLALATGSSYIDAITNHNNKTSSSYYPAAMRRIYRLMIHGSLNNRLKDTLTERGLLRLVAYYAGENPEIRDKYQSLDTLGWRQETRNNKIVYVLDWD
jgi:hypothetical protein